MSSHPPESAGVGGEDKDKNAKIESKLLYLC